MKIEHDIDLSRYTTFKMGGKCKSFYCPESEEELTEFLNNIESTPLFLGGGSNLLINDNKIFDSVVCLRQFNNHIKNHGDGYYTVGASMKLQELIIQINTDGYGGIEYLYSVPGLVGGAIVMNAGRGKSFHKSISDYLILVTVLENGSIRRYKKEECIFSYRTSLFKNKSCVILSADFMFDKGNSANFEFARNVRMEFVRQTQDCSAPNFGSVFCVCSPEIMDKVRSEADMNDRICFSSRTANWLLNYGGTFKEAMNKIRYVQHLHQVQGKKCELEVMVWK